MIQAFADPECTQYADGTQSTVYMRINSVVSTDYFFGDIDDWKDMAAIYVENLEPDQPAGLCLWVDYLGETPLVDGSVMPGVYPVVYDNPDDTPIEGLRTVWE